MAVIESHEAIEQNSETVNDYSEQYLVDCDHNGNNGCNGGWPPRAFQTIQRYGIPTEKEYPYYGRELGICLVNDKAVKI